MPTEAKLEIQGLSPIEVPSDGATEAWRHLYGPDDFLRSLGRFLEEDEPSTFGSDLRLPEQIDNLFDAFVSGRRLHHDREFHSMKPEQDAVWELITPDLRIFGWFLKRDHFACMNIMKADAAKGTGENSGLASLYGPVRREVIRRRVQLGCYPALCVLGSEPYDVVSVRDRG